MEPRATILHADLDSFYAAVEQRDDPRLRGRPVIVGGGVVLSSSYEARACGVRTAMAGRMARALCPEAVVVRPRMSAYAAASRAVFAVLAELAPVVEPLSIDEAFLDVRGLDAILGSPARIAVRLRREVRARVGLPITVGVARTKFLAKVASAVAKPDGLLVIDPAQELAFLHPLPVERLWGVGPATALKLRAVGISTVGEVAALSETTLTAVLGRAAGRHLHALAANRDPRPVRPGRRRRSVGAQSALGRGPHPRHEVEAALAAVVERAAQRLRAGARSCTTIQLRIRFGDYARGSRSRSLARPTDETAAILMVARSLLAGSWPAVFERGLTLVGVGLLGLVDRGGDQLALPLDRRRELDSAIDLIRNRFGDPAVKRATLLRLPVEDALVRPEDIS